MITSILSRRPSGIDFAARVHFRLVFFFFFFFLFFFNYMCIIVNSFMVVIFTFTFGKLSRLQHFSLDGANSNFALLGDEFDLVSMRIIHFKKRPIMQSSYY